MPIPPDVLKEIEVEGQAYEDALVKQLAEESTDAEDDQ
jgi:hypothetical protein